MYAEVTAVDPDKLVTAAPENKAATYAMASYTERIVVIEMSYAACQPRHEFDFAWSRTALRKHMAGVGMLLSDVIIPHPPARHQLELLDRLKDQQVPDLASGLLLADYLASDRRLDLGLPDLASGLLPERQPRDCRHRRR